MPSAPAAWASSTAQQDRRAAPSRSRCSAAAIAARVLRRFEQEAQVLGRLHHPGIAQVYGWPGTAPIAGALVMELVAGRRSTTGRARGVDRRARPAEVKSATPCSTRTSAA